MKQIGFDNNKYIELQTNKILERVSKYKRLYLEFGGKLFNDGHAERVLPGYEPNVKLQVLKTISHMTEAIICIYAGDIINNKVKSDNGKTYSDLVLESISILRDVGVKANSVVITRYDEFADLTHNLQPQLELVKKLAEVNVRVYYHNTTKGYPYDVNTIVSPEGYGQNSFIQTTMPIVLVTAPGANSGKLATCLSQIYHHHKNDDKVGYAKFETFPVWDLDINDPINIAYESATMDIDDKNKLDTYHIKAYGQVAVNYNRDLDTFPILKCILERASGECEYKSPTDMGVNVIAKCITDKTICENAAKKEIIRRHSQMLNMYVDGKIDRLDVIKSESILNKVL